MKRVLNSVCILLAVVLAYGLPNTNKRAEVPTLLEPSPGYPDDEAEDFIKKVVVYYDFENNNSDSRRITDRTNSDNHGTMHESGIIVKIPQSTCGNAAYLWCGDITMPRENFQGKPLNGITVMAWVKIMKPDGMHSIFDTVGLTHDKGQYHFEVNYGILRWFHRNEHEEQVFNVMGATVPKKRWTHIAATYSVSTGIAQIYIDAVPTNRTYGQGKLSRDWSQRAAIGNHANRRPLNGYIDEFRIFNYALTSQEIAAHKQKCSFPGQSTAVPPKSSSATQPAPSKSSYRKSLRGKSHREFNADAKDDDEDDEEDYDQNTAAVESQDNSANSEQRHEIPDELVDPKESSMVKEHIESSYQKDQVTVPETMGNAEAIRPQTESASTLF